MTAAAPYRYVSGFCGAGRHDHCRGTYSGVTCTCPHHTEPDPEPEPVAAHHCPSCTCQELPGLTVASNPCPVYSHGSDGFHCSIEGPHEQHRNAAGDITW